MNSNRNLSSKLNNSNGGKKHDASTKPTSAQRLPQAPARSAGHSFNKRAPGKPMAGKGKQGHQRPKPKPNQAQASHGNVAASSTKKKVDFQTLLQRCLDGASADKQSHTENAEKTNASLANIYRLFKRVKVDHGAKEALDQAFQKIGIKTSVNTTTEFTALVKFFYGKKTPRSTISRYANTLQYARVKKVASQELMGFVQDEGGTAECARKIAKERKAVADASGKAEAAVAKIIKERLVDAPKVKIPREMEVLKKGLVAVLVKVEADGSCPVLGYRPVLASTVRSFSRLKAKSSSSVVRKRP